MSKKILILEDDLALFQWNWTRNYGSLDGHGFNLVKMLLVSESGKENVEKNNQYDKNQGAINGIKFRAPSELLASLFGHNADLYLMDDLNSQRSNIYGYVYGYYHTVIDYFIGYQFFWNKTVLVSTSHSVRNILQQRIKENPEIGFHLADKGPNLYNQIEDLLE